MNEKFEASAPCRLVWPGGGLMSFGGSSVIVRGSSGLFQTILGIQSHDARSTSFLSPSGVTGIDGKSE